MDHDLEAWGRKALEAMTAWRGRGPPERRHHPAVLEIWKEEMEDDKDHLDEKILGLTLDEPQLRGLLEEHLGQRVTERS